MDHIILGIREEWGQEVPFALFPEDRRQHLYTIGKTGTGKTTLLRNLILQDIEAGHGVGVIDPHGDLATDILDYIPRRRVEDVAYFNPADLGYPVGFNLLGQAPRDERHLVTSGIVSAFQGIWPDFWGPRLEYILHAAVAARGQKFYM
jgi:DNA helicase HerA-like ATPase